MRISDEVFNQLCPSYKNFIIELEQRLEECNDDFGKQFEIFLDFSLKYLMPINYWYDIIRTPCNIASLNNLLLKRAKQQFMVRAVGPKEIGGSKDKMTTFLFSHEYDSVDFQFDKSDLSFPHPHLNGCLYKIEIESEHFLPKKLFEMCNNKKEWYTKIKAVEGDVEEWTKMLCKYFDETGNDEYVRIMIENRLGTNLFDIKLWKLYIEYLRVHDLQDMLQLYSKYCRFFVDDLVMKEIYKIEVEKYGPVYVEWNDLFEFETRMPKIEEVDEGEDFENMNLKKFYHENQALFFNYDDIKPSPIGFGLSLKMDAKVYANSENENQAPTNSSKFVALPITPEMITSIFSGVYANVESDSDDMDSDSDNDNDDDPMDVESLEVPDFYANYSIQQFPFKTPFMKYIMDKANATVLRKLHHSCKFFFHQKPFPICYRFFQNRETQFFEDSLGFHFFDEEMENFNAKICKNFIIANSIINELSSDNFIPKILSKIHRCDAKYIEIQCNLTPTEMKILLQSGNVIIFKWKNMYRSKNLYCPALEEVSQYLPKIEELTLLPVIVTPKTCEALLQQKFESKIYSLKLRQIKGELLNAEKFLQFVQKNRAEMFILDTGFHYTFAENPARFLEYKEAMEAYQKAATLTTDFSISANDGIGF